MLSQKKNPGYIDFKTINEITIDRHPSKYFGVITLRYYSLEICFNYKVIILIFL